MIPIDTGIPSTSFDPLAFRVAIVGPVYPYRGGIAHFNSLLIRTLEAQNYSVFAISFQRQYPAFLYPGKSDKDPSQNPIKVEAEYLLDPIYPWTWKKTVDRIITLHPTVVLFHWWTTFWAPAYSSLVARLQRKGIRTVFIVHNILPHEAHPWDRWLAKIAFSTASNFIVMTDQEKDKLSRLKPGAHITLLPHPVYDVFSGQRVSRDTARYQLGIPKDYPVALFFGIVRPYKGLEDLIQAIAHLNNCGEKVFLLVAGEFWEDLEKYRYLISRLGIDKHTKIIPRYIKNEEISVLFSAADVFIAPYRSATQSGSAKIAIGFGLPIVVSEVIANDQSISRYPSHITVPTADVEQLAKGISESLKVPINNTYPDIKESDLSWQVFVHSIEKNYLSKFKPDVTHK